MVRYATVLAIALASAMPHARAGQTTQKPASITGRIRALPVVNRFAYTVNAAIRPFPLVWIGRSGVGSAEFTHRQGANGARAYEFIVGSDPARAPRGINRWGYLAEEVGSDGGSIVGLMKQSDEQTIRDVAASTQREAATQQFKFKVYAGALRTGESLAGDTTVALREDFTKNGFERLLGVIAPTDVPLQAAKLHPGTRPGILTTLMELLRETARAWRADSSRPAKGSRLRCLFNNATYELTVTSTTALGAVVIGGRRYENVLRAELEGVQPGTDKRMHFEVVFPPTGSLAEVPLRVIVQPRWWFRFELLLVSANTPA